MAQTVQSAQQMAYAQALMQNYGSQAIAYLQASAVTGKPLASMLSSLALLQQAQQQQQAVGLQQQQQQQAMASALPKRGRGSRGGSLARSRGGVNSSLKLKRLDSGELALGGRGAGRGRGSRGRRRMEGGYSSDFLYYMNEGGIRSGSTIGNFLIFHGFFVFVVFFGGSDFFAFCHFLITFCIFQIFRFFAFPSILHFPRNLDFLRFPNFSSILNFPRNFSVKSKLIFVEFCTNCEKTKNSETTKN